MWAVWAVWALVAVAQETGPPPPELITSGTLGDYTGPVSTLMATLLALDRFGVLRLGRRDETPAEAPQVAALGAKVEHMHESLGHVKRQAEKSYRDRTEHAVLLQTMRADIQRLREDWGKARTEDRADIAARFAEITAAIKDLR
jgi:hypothetical protein